MEACLEIYELELLHVGNKLQVCLLSVGVRHVLILSQGKQVDVQWERFCFHVFCNCFLGAFNPL